MIPPNNGGHVKGAAIMERSNYDCFMEYLQPLEAISRAAITGTVLWEQLQECEAAGISPSDVDANAMAREVERRMMEIHGELYALALYEWADAHYSGKSEQSTDQAADDGGFSSTQTQINSE